MASRIKLDTNSVDWVPAGEVWPGYRLEHLPPEADAGRHGMFLKVLRSPDDGGGCWCALLRFAPPPGHAIRVTATAASDEEVLIISGGSGSFTCNPEGLRHGNTLTQDTTAFVHYHRDPDDVIKTEVIALSDLPGRPEMRS